MNNKIALFLSDLSGGGAEKVMLELAKEFTGRGLDVDFLLRSRTGRYVNDVTDNLKVVVLKKKNNAIAVILLLKHFLMSHSRLDVFSVLVRILHLKGKGALSGLLPVIEYLNSEKPGALLSTLESLNCTCVLGKIVTGSDCRLIIRAQNYYSYNIKEREGATRVLTQLLYKRTDVIDKIIAVSAGVKEDLVSALAIPSEKIQVVYNPVFLEDIRKKKDEEAGFPPFSDLKRNFKIILGAGRLFWQKAFEDLVAAFSLLRQKRDVRLVILGEGEERAKLEGLISDLNIKDEVFLPGFVENPYAYMSKADVFVLSSRWEGFPNVIAQSLACGTPVVSTDCPSGPSEILKEGEFGKLVPVGDTAVMARAIEETLDNPLPPRILIRRAMDFDIKKIADEYLQVITGASPQKQHFKS